MANPAVVVDFVANTKDLQAGLNNAGKSASGFKQRLGGLAKAGALAGLAALTATLKIGVDEFAEAQKVAAQTGAVLKSTGGAANVTAKHIGELSEALMKKSGVDDEAIQSGQNVLLTFTNIRNEAGKGKDIFDQTTKAALDMSVALGTDMKSASMQLGKALNDPVKGMSKLTKQGVTFTDAQKKQAEAMVAAGDTAGAQALILEELNKEFGGSAEAAGKTLPGQLNILKQTFSNLAGELVGRMVPALTAVAKFLLENKTAVMVVAGVLTGLIVAYGAVAVATKAWAAAQVVAGAATKAWAATQWLLNAALSANPIGIVIVAVAALVAGLIVAYKTSDKFRAIVDAAFKAVLGAAKAVFNWLKSNWPLLLGILGGPLGAAVVLVIKHWDKIRDGARNAFDAVRRILNDLREWIAVTFMAAIRGVLDRVGNVFDNIADGARAAFNAVKNIFNNMIEWIRDLAGRIGNVARNVADAIKNPINAVIGAWNSLGIPRVAITLPRKKILGKWIGGGSFGFGPFNFPDIPKLAAGGIVTGPTLAMIGEAGPEAVVPLTGQGNAPIEVRVFIGNTELKDLVRTEIVDTNTGIARTLLAGGVH